MLISSIKTIVRFLIEEGKSNSDLQPNLMDLVIGPLILF